MSTNLGFQTVDTLASSQDVPEAIIASRGTTEAGLPLGLDLEAGCVRVLVEFPLPQNENQIGARLGKKNKETGEQPVTSRIYGRSSNQKIYVKDGEGNVMQIAARLSAPVAGVEEDDAGDAEV